MEGYANYSVNKSANSIATYNVEISFTLKVLIAVIAIPLAVLVVWWYTNNKFLQAVGDAIIAVLQAVGHFITSRFLQGIISLTAFGLGLMTVYSLLGFDLWKATEEDMQTSLMLGLLIPVDYQLLAWAIPALLIGWISTSFDFALRGFAKAAIIVSILMMLLSLTKLGTAIPFLVWEVSQNV